MPGTTSLDNLEITWLGHASFKIKSPDLIIYIDPYQVSRGEKADIILATHEHFDHYDEASVTALSKDNTIVVGPKSVASKARGKVLEAGQALEIKGVSIKAVPAYNMAKPFHPKGSGVGFVIKIADKTIYHAGDTDKIPEMAKLAGIDLALLPIGGTYTMDEAEAAGAVKVIKPKIAIPMHYGALKETRGVPEKFKELVGDAAEVRIL